MKNVSINTFRTPRHLIFVDIEYDFPTSSEDYWHSNIWSCVSINLIV